MSNYYKKLYFDQVENNQIMSREIKRLENNNESLKKIIERDRDEVLQEMEGVNEQYLTEIFILQYELDKINNKRKYDLCFIKHLKEDKKELKEKIDNAINYIKWHYDLGTKENVEFCLLRDRLLEILGDKGGD